MGTLVERTINQDQLVNTVVTAPMISKSTLTELRMVKLRDRVLLSSVND